MVADYNAMLLPKDAWKGKKAKRKKSPKHKKRKSILQDEHDKRCYLSMLLDGDYREKQTEEHHVIFGSGRRKISDAYGLTVRLSVEYHREGPKAVHNNTEMADLLKRIAQKRFEEVYPDEDWMQVVGRNYL